MFIIKEASGKRVSSMSDVELVTEYYLQWTGAAEAGKSGLSSNPRAQRLGDACYERFSNWGEFEDLLMAEEDKAEAEVKAAHPEWDRPTGINIYKSAKERAKIVVPWINANAKKLKRN